MVVIAFEGRRNVRQGKITNFQSVYFQYFLFISTSTASSMVCLRTATNMHVVVLKYH